MNHPVISITEVAGFRRDRQLDAWRRLISGPAASDHPLVFVISFAFAAAIFRWVEAIPFAAHLSGSTADRRSQLLNAATSVWGGAELIQVAAVGGMALSGRPLAPGLFLFRDVPLEEVERMSAKPCSHAMVLTTSVDQTAQAPGSPPRLAANGFGGAAGSSFLMQLCRLPVEELRGRIRVAADAYLANTNYWDCGDAERRRLDQFAFVAAAGELASDLEITGWQPGTATQACLTPLPHEKQSLGV